MSRAAIDGVDDMGPGARQSIHAPDHRGGGLGDGFHARLDLADARPEIGAEPGHDEGDGLALGQGGIQAVERRDQIGQAFNAVLVLRGGGAIASTPPFCWAARWWPSC